MCMHHIVICGLPGSILFFHIISHTARFSKTVTEHKMCFLIFSTNFVWNIFHSKKKWARYDRKCILVFMWSTLYSSPIWMTLEFSRQIFKNYSDMKFLRNLSTGSRVVPWRRTDRQTDMTNLIVAFRNFSNGPKSRWEAECHKLNTVHLHNWRKKKQTCNEQLPLIENRKHSYMFWLLSIAFFGEYQYWKTYRTFLYSFVMCWW